MVKPLTNKKLIASFKYNANRVLTPDRIDRAVDDPIHLLKTGNINDRTEHLSTC
jgi:hypothetical protein